MRLLLLAGDESDLDLLETGLPHEAVERALTEPEPDVGVELAGALKRVLLEIEHEQLSAATQDAECFVHRVLRVMRMVESLTEDGQVD